ncbi:PREDICTED: leucine-rich repeat, immunoglobulin-like domain and transmembrane domain-containing protein 1 isoform X2 [Poecilia mexicana]|uniref:Leucine-rich repeat, immunoglobulin-like domain and transmembrane domain-containing protein 1 n=1 Tax=Poecilia formosa TaxID=48698 RepID=A0A087XKE6_POEFO|nr:PREDICTED: leucine-rich repeat, immunoglobulin-like domain and transmembrane domain-containing protein 1 isoform X2 [Poecilia formosa]XP_014824632.1 PREDICTED: leucine-rich repeat, immunoglobulin-like domain and transmembrane domain-containing protein 1 isoform X2 [Poecilia mexicana]
MFRVLLLGLCVATLELPSPVSSCPSQCSCFYHNLSDGSKARSVICNDPDISLVPVGFPVDASKLRIEKTAIQQIPSEAFGYLSSLEFLWMSFNTLSDLSPESFRGLFNLEELRLDGNALTAFPWESLLDMPSLRLLDLHNNQLTSLPAEATTYIKNLTYLDLSSNSLLTLPIEVLTNWLAAKPVQGPESSKMILGLHDNPWVCDCRLYDLVQFQKSPTLSVAFIDTRLRCSAPESFSGVLFSDAELRQCQLPRIHTAVARVRSAVGNNVLLRCGTIGVPVPDLTWRRADGQMLNGTVQQETSKEGITWSILSVPAVSYRDSGKFICKASNYAGNAEAVISLVVSNTPRPEGNQTNTDKKVKVKKPNPVSYSLTDGATQDPSASPNSDALLDLEKTNLSNLAANTSSLQQDPDRVVRSVKVVGDTDNTISLNWRAPKAKNTTAFSVLYAVFGERDMRKINVGAGQTRVTIDGLVPRTKYIACVCVKGLIPKKEQCVIFSTDEAASATGTQKLINVIVITVACVIAVPLTVIVCCGALKRRIKKYWGKKSKDIQDSYVTFETLSPGTKAKGLEGEYLNRLNQEESNRLLSARSSLDSESTAKIEGQPNEYFC